MGSKEEVLGQLESMAAEVKADFTDPRDEARVSQALSSLQTAHMAIGHLHDERQNRRDLVAVHQAEAAANGRYADERSRNPDMYANHYPDPEYDRPESEALA
jgi:hypothetical protein